MTYDQLSNSPNPWSSEYYRELDSSTALQVGKVAVHPDGIALAQEIVATGSDGLTVSAGPNAANLNGGLLGFWGLAEVEDTQGDITYRLPPDVSIEHIANPAQNPEIVRVAAELETHGFAKTSFEELGFSGQSFDFAGHLKAHYYDAGRLKVCRGDRPPDRARARGRGYYDFRQEEGVIYTPDGRCHNGGFVVGDFPDLSVQRKEDDEIAISAYPRIELTNDDSLLAFGAVTVRWSSKLVGRFGEDFFRTRNHVVEKAHQDGTELVAVAVIDVDAGGAVTHLFRNVDGKPGERVFEGRLEPSEVLVFKDADFWHTTSEPIPLFPDHKPYRDALIVTAETGGDNWPQELPRLLAHGSPG